MSEEMYHLGIKALIRSADGKVLLLRVNNVGLKNNTHGQYWDLPGGRVQKGQTELETLRREVAEETGISLVKKPKSLGMVMSNIRIPLKSGDSVGLILGVYECDVADVGELKLSDEHEAFDWFLPKDAADLLQVKYPEEFCKVVRAL